MGNALVIVESPAKAKTIEKYLGTGYRVSASMGHLRDLPKSTLGVDIDGGFIPDYQPIKNREETIDKLRQEAAAASRVYLATDPDREGEAISWHLKELLNLPDDKTCRVTFNEITKKVVLDSVQKPRQINMALVDAQQARRILDRIVGYKLSPLLWTKIRRGLSAGRVQSVATRMVVDREEEIRAFQPQEYWLLDAALSCADGGGFTARFHGTEKKKQELKSRAEVDAVMDAVGNAPFSVLNVKRTDKHRAPAAPFITSTLQQEASRKLNMTPRRAMSIAQQLYEGLPVAGQDSVGLITYMRTDSLRISDEAAAAAKQLIEERYGKEFYPASPRVYKSGKNAQDAHEAIRPSNVSLLPEEIHKDLTEDQFRLYRLIWSRFMASQMASAVYDSVTIDALSAGYVFKASSSSLKFAGFTRVYDSQTEDAEAKGDKLPPLAVGDGLRLVKLSEEQKFTQPPARYTEDTLIRAMEEKGIGRPSTYAPTMSTILDREYVVKEGKSLRPTALGETVTKFMEDRFSNIVDVQFTANMEGELDQVEEGQKPWKAVLQEFYTGFHNTLEEAEVSLQGVRIKVPDEVTSEICPNCGKNLVVKSSRFGRFLGCPGFPECRFTKPIVIEMPGRCPKCGARILKRSSKKGYTYYACERGMECGFMTWDVPVKDDCPVCGQTMFKRSGKGYKRPYCINEACSAFLPEDKRGYKKKAAAAEGEAQTSGEAAEQTPAGEPEAAAAEKKPATKKPAGAKKAAAEKKTAAKKPAAKKTTTAKKTAAAKKSAAEKPAAKKPAAAKKTASKKPAAAPEPDHD